jgi:putative phosphoribosyl transferase
MTTTAPQQFKCREEAGRQLANQLAAHAGRRDVVILALPSGGVPIAAEISNALNVPYDILLVRKIRVPGGGDHALGAVTGGGVRMLNWEMIDRLNLSRADVNTAILAESMELARREQLFRGTRPSYSVADCTAILVDDGTTPCSLIRDAIRLIRRQHADHVIVALPVACSHTACDLRMEADELVTLVEDDETPSLRRRFKNFPEISDDDVCRLMAER